MRSRRLALPPRCGSMLSSRCLAQRRPRVRYLLVLLRYIYLAQQDPRTMVLDNRTRSVGLKEDLIL